MIRTSTHHLDLQQQGYRIRTWLLCFILSAPTLLSAQTDFRAGYIVRNADTTKGFVAYRLNKKNIEECVFKESKKAKTIRYKATEISGFGINGDKSYQSLELPKDAPAQGRVFVKAVVRGYLNLYQHKDFYLLKRKDSLITLPVPRNEVYGPIGDQKTRKDSKFVGVLTYLMLDCPRNLIGISYSEGPLSKVIYDYNKCSKVPTSKNTRPMGRVGLSLFTGYVNSTLNYDVKNVAVASAVVPFKSSTVIGGASIDLSSPRVFDKFFFSIEAWYVKNFYQGLYAANVAGDRVEDDIYAEFTSLKIPFGIKYNFRSPNNTPYFKMGVFWNSTSSSSLRTVEQKIRTDAIYTYEYIGGYKIKNPKGFWLAVGYDKTLFGNTRFFTEFRYERAEGYFGTPVVSDSRMFSYNILAGLRF